MGAAVADVDGGGLIVMEVVGVDAGTDAAPDGFPLVVVGVGVGFGVVRALVLLGVFYLVFNAATPPERVPAWIKDATLYPLASFSAKALMALAPQGSAVVGRAVPALEDAVRDGSSDANMTAGKGYDQQSRDEVDALVEQNR